ncbi:Tripeptidyl aminopeptidase [Lachnellula subtilissima]|uniref:Tripeptidyl aminopeptidase n=1 Tax=Lachnellula subtilissima TaxID=602034 RepID=A0A8H8UEY9_9HELO|nr:Tripeptidyl aminopeptidase [Lachnellula subtilissima]
MRNKVPLDWLDPSEKRRAAIAILRFNATDTKDYKGPVFINPGGPGGSGIWFVKHLGPYYQSVVGKNHDIISFDPRGVGASTPRISCWEDMQDSKIWNFKDVDVLDAHPGSLYDAYAHAAASSQQCASILQPSTKSDLGVGSFVSTASVARDMLEIMTKVGEEKLKYWGFSYGTYLGATFAAMFPDKVGRMVNDGNVDAVEYSAGRGIHFIQDADKIMAAFYHFCHVGGMELCAFHLDSEKDIETRLAQLLEHIRKNPVIVPGTASSSGRPQIVSYSKVKRMIGSTLYRPLVMFPALADALAALEIGDGTVFLELATQKFDDPLLCETRYSVQEGGDPTDPTPETPEAEASEDAGTTILCSDGGWMNDTVDEFGSYVDGLMTRSQSVGAIMAEMRLACVHWSVQAKWKFNGPFEGNTSHPILFIANRADNVTPLRSAQINAKGFPGSVILVQNGYGHTSLSAPSKCTAKIIRAYFQNGTLPAPDTVCEPDLTPFEPYNATSSIAESCDDHELNVALFELMKAPVVGA